eukprot:TRINITY_DN5968_c0_g1_i1.p1 TRINITY_DN5968_c0_g1~~TRINITY_DN5968_c0_g1_i1.p1  ORF type:complete len:277 (+),score=42.30 TRINITY_DN5968_c0_g1_i1:91-921(+)
MTSETYRPRLWSAVVKERKLLEEDKEKKEDSPSTILEREDKRATSQFRPLYMKTGAITQAQGSAYIELNQTKIICSIYGPRQSQKLQLTEKGKFWCDFKYAPFALEQRRKRGQDPDEKEYSVILAEAIEPSVMLEKFPRSVVEAYIVVLEADDTGVLPMAITCVSLALADAGIELYDLVSSCSVAQLSKECLLDPTLAEEEDTNCTSKLMLSIMASRQEVTHLIQTGVVDEATAKQMTELCSKGCTKLHSIMRQTLVTSAAKKTQQRKIGLKMQLS